MLGPTAFLTKGKPGQGASGLGLGPTDTLTGGRKTAALAGDANEASSARGRKGAGEDGRRKAKKNPATRRDKSRDDHWLRPLQVGAAARRRWRAVGNRHAGALARARRQGHDG